jgi:hypothetical protein
MKRFCLVIYAVLLLFCAAPISVSAQNPAVKIPPEVKTFVEKGAAAIALETGDLNGDGTMDFILVTEKTKDETGDPDDAEDERSLLILVRDRAGVLTLAKRNEKVVYCRSCGGVMGDPFAGVEVRRNGFTVNNYGGSSWRWSESYDFNYSRRDNTWRLVRATEETFNALEPKKVKTKILLPKTFGKIDINDFDPAKIGKRD